MVGDWDEVQQSEKGREGEGRSEKVRVWRLKTVVVVVVVGT